MIDRESNRNACGIKEAIRIRKMIPMTNPDEGDTIWGGLLAMLTGEQKKN